MRILVTGSNSLLGKALWESAPPNANLLLTDLPDKKISHPVFACEPLDVTEKPQVTRLVKRFKPQVILHLAALSNVDFCEHHPKQAYAVNVQGTKNIIGSAKRIGAKILFTSSNGIFNGTKAPYNERHRPKPIHSYGKTKFQAEKLIQQSKIPCIITRLITMYGWPPEGARQNPVTWTLKKLENSETLHMVSDCFINPLYAASAAEAIWKLIQADLNGIYHIAGKTRVNRYTWTVEIAKTFSYDTRNIKPVASSFFPQLTPRPRNTCFDTRKIQKRINWKPLTLKDGLKRMRQSAP